MVVLPRSVGRTRRVHAEELQARASLRRSRSRMSRQAKAASDMAPREARGKADLPSPGGGRRSPARAGGVGKARLATSTEAPMLWGGNAPPFPGKVPPASGAHGQNHPERPVVCAASGQERAILTQALSDGGGRAREQLGRYGWPGTSPGTGTLGFDRFPGYGRVGKEPVQRLAMLGGKACPKQRASRSCPTPPTSVNLTALARESARSRNGASIP
ncbi:hypothetical protein DFJ74DRAFT_677693 [Hyaloraphidium curvatum]|nr:hypothetical protein DFJ74DRAFT_677693 [Hyaloraphidium curvatum]